MCEGQSESDNACTCYSRECVCLCDYFDQVKHTQFLCSKDSIIPFESWNFYRNWRKMSIQKAIYRSGSITTFVVIVEFSTEGLNRCCVEIVCECSMFQVVALRIAAVICISLASASYPYHSLITFFSSMCARLEIAGLIYTSIFARKIFVFACTYVCSCS